MFAARYLCLCLLTLVAGCQPPTPDPDRPPAGKGGKGEPTAAADPKLLEPLMLAEKPADALSVAQVRNEARDGNRVVIKGTIPPATVYVLRQSFAEVRLMDKEKLESEEVKTEFDCDHGLTCAACQETLNKHSVAVELVGPGGDAPLKTTLKGFQAINYGSTLYFQGKVHKKGEHVKILAEKFYVEN